MPTLDIHGDNSTTTYDKIQFTDEAYLTKESGGWFYIRTNMEGAPVPELASVYIRDIDNLILALQKAKELWGNE